MSGSVGEQVTWQAGIDYVVARAGKRFHSSDFDAYVTDRVVAETGRVRNDVQAGFARAALRRLGIIRQVGDGWWEPTGESTTVEVMQTTWDQRPRPAVAPVRAPAARKKAPPKPPLCPFCHYRHEGGQAECLH